MLRRILSSVALLCVILASAPAALPQANPSPLIRVGTGPDDQSVPLFYADKAGIYKKYGLNVQIVKVPGAAAVAAALAGGSLEIGKGSPTGVIAAVAKGLPLTVIGAISFWDSARPDNGLIVSAGSSIKDAKDMSGKTLASVSLADLTTLATYAWLEAHGVDSSTIKWTELPASAVAGAIDQGRIAGSTVYEPYFSTDLSSGKFRLLSSPYDALGKRFANAVLFATSSWTNEHPDLVAKFLRATQESAAYIATHDSEANALVAEAGGLDPATLTKIRHPQRGVPIEPSDLQPVIDAAAKYKVIPTDVSGGDDHLQLRVEGQWRKDKMAKLTTDVVIVGAGLAGLVAAIEARAHGADALVLDKLPDPASWNAVGPLPGGIGNDTWRSGGGGLARFESEVLIEHLAGGPDALAAGRNAVEVLLQRHMERSEGAINETLLRTYCERIFDDCCWLRDEIGLQYVDGRGRSVKGYGVGLFQWLHKTAVERGVRIMFSTRVESLVIGGSSSVTGVRASTDGRSFEIAARAVILATGGFQGNREMLAKHNDVLSGTDVTTVGSPENTGDGHRMAIEAGAALQHLSVCHVRTTDIYFGPGPSRNLMHIYPMGIYFNQNFERFVDESVEDSDTIANAIALQPGAIAGLLFDDKARQQFSKEYDAYPRREQVICTAGSIAELAGKMHVSSEGLGRLVDAFNASVIDGRAWGPNVPKTRSALRIDTAPFHGFYPVRPALNHTLGGIAVDGTSCQVIAANGRAIAGLFAAGTAVNWANGRCLDLNGIKSYRGSYHAGASSGAGVALVLGRLAAQHAVAALALA